MSSPSAIPPAELHLHHQPSSIPGTMVFVPNLAGKLHHLDSSFLIQVRDAPFQAFSQCHCGARTLTATLLPQAKDATVTKTLRIQPKSWQEKNLAAKLLYVELPFFFPSFFDFLGPKGHGITWGCAEPGTSIWVPTRTPLGEGRATQRGKNDVDDADASSSSASPLTPREQPAPVFSQIWPPKDGMSPFHIPKRGQLGSASTGR